MSAKAPQQRQTWNDALDIALDLYAWTKPGRDGRRFLQESLSENSRGLPEPTQDLQRHLYETEHEKLRNPDPIFVAAEMCELVEHAAKSFQPEPFMPTDLMTAHGFLVWERPFVVPDRFDTPIPLRGMSWSPILSTESSERVAGRVAENEFLGWLQERDYVASWQAEEGGVDGMFLTLYSDNLRLTRGTENAPALLPLHLTPWWFGMAFEGNEQDELGNPTGAVWWWKIAQTTLRLMQQRIAHPMHQRPDRSTRRRVARADWLDRDTVVVRLRRPKGESHDETGTANYSHRFMVSGHWRQQWYPSEQTHRQIWISPYVKGDPDLPLIWRPNRAYSWGR